MPKYYCEYCNIYLTHSSPAGRKQHAHGRKHINNKIEYFTEFLIEQQGLATVNQSQNNHNPGYFLKQQYTASNISQGVYLPPDFIPLPK
jgi:U1 snRNP-specific protein C